ncbi:hypothetical protein, partial [Streptomyces sp. NPDC046685]|uniref:hypothetical protein n=1 Tax=Streptomyces sp. NPDC046685 TaxID=3157202 RepID=UPI0033E195EE
NPDLRYSISTGHPVTSVYLTSGEADGINAGAAPGSARHGHGTARHPARARHGTARARPDPAKPAA